MTRFEKRITAIGATLGVDFLALVLFSNHANEITACAFVGFTYVCGMIAGVAMMHIGYDKDKDDG